MAQEKIIAEKPKATKDVEDKKGLYTSIFVYHAKTIFVNQFYCQELDLEQVLFVWSELAKRKILIGRKFKQALKDELEVEHERLSSMVDNKNAWWCFFTLKERIRFCCLSSLVVVKTDQQLIGGSSHQKYKAWQAHARYSHQYEGLKNTVIQPWEKTKERKKAEHLMRYWETQKTIFSTHQEAEPGFYTIVMEYNGDVFVFQFYLPSGENLHNLFTMWLVDLKKHHTFDNGYEKDYEIIDYVATHNTTYSLAPVLGLINVWSTYFMLSKGLGNIYVVKTDKEITPGG